MIRLPRSDPSSAGIVRRKSGKRFSCVGAAGEPIADPTVLGRIDALVIPPAWLDVWISPYEHARIQAVGTDAAGRKQYRYHDEWRKKRDLAKFDRILDFAEMLPRLRQHVARDLALPGMSERRVLACRTHAGHRIFPGRRRGIQRAEPGRNRRAEDQFTAAADAPVTLD